VQSFLMSAWFNVGADTDPMSPGADQDLCTSRVEGVLGKIHKDEG
jgi:hypothetical protein